MCPQIFTDFLEERGHWPALCLKADLHNLFGKTVYAKAESNPEKKDFYY